MAPVRKATSDARSEVDKQLAKYRSMRDFSVTAEPSGGKKAKSAKANPFVVQKHAATRLHYDFRLGWRGVLKSWAITKGPSYVPADKRLAVQVEDHPMEYGGFEGAIPQGQYGGGTVMLWDEGTWEPQPGRDVDADLRDGHLKFVLHGQKLKGKWALIRMGGRAARQGKANWLLIKEHDENERGPGDPDITVEKPNSVVTKRSMDQIGAQQDHVWQSNKASSATRKAQSAEARLRAKLQAKAAAPAKTAAAPRDTRTTAKKQSSANKTKSKDDKPAAEFIAPELAYQADRPPSGPEWLHELKYDGYRIEAICNGNDVRLFTRSGLDWTHRMPRIAAELARLNLRNSVLDGEVVVLDQRGISSFALLQASFQDGRNAPMLYCVFDLLEHKGEDKRKLPLIERKGELAKLLEGAGRNSCVRYSDHVLGQGDELFAQACRLGAEGIVSKRSESPYRSSRAKDWIKVKCYKQQELVIGGYTLPTHESRGIGALLLGYYQNGKLIHAGRAGTGFTEQSGSDLRKRLDRLKRDTMPFESVPRAAAKDAVWVRPELVCEVSFSTWTADGNVRQASFLGLREDKNPKDVHREGPMRTYNIRTTENGEKSKAKFASHPGGKKSAKAAPTSAVRLTHPDKILDKETGTTKRQLVDYLAAVANVMLPHVIGRPVSLLRCPEGVGRPCFYQKHTSKGLPEGIGAVDISEKDGKTAQYVTIDNAMGLIGTAQMGIVELHPWGSSSATLEQPDRLIFDLDPDTSLSWHAVANAAMQVRRLLHKHGLKSFVKVSGGKGLHVVAPIAPQAEWPVVKQFCKALAEELEAESPDLYLIKASKSERVGKIFIDYMRNERGATAVAPWSPRARAGVAVAVPITWTELHDSKAMPQFRVADFAKWKSRLSHDPWKQMLTTEQHLPSSLLKANMPIPPRETRSPHHASAR